MFVTCGLLSGVGGSKDGLGCGGGLSMLSPEWEGGRDRNQCSLRS